MGKTLHDGGGYTAAAGQRTGASYNIRACGALRRAAGHNIIIGGRYLRGGEWGGGFHE